MALKTDYKNDIPKTEKRKYRIINNDDGTVSFEDVTEYEQIGDTFGAGDINETNKAVNGKLDNSDVVDPMMTTEPGFAADALLVKLMLDGWSLKVVDSLPEQLVPKTLYMCRS